MQIDAITKGSILSGISFKKTFRAADIIMILSASLSALAVPFAGNKGLFALAIMAGAGASAITAYKAARRRRLKTYKDDIFASLLYGAFLSLAAVSLRDALGYLELPPFAGILTGQIPHELLSAGTAQSVYDKSGIKTLLSSFLFILLFGAVIIQSASVYLSIRTGFKGLSPVTPVVMLLLFICFTIYPPARIDFTHWASWIGPASGIGQGRWPYIHTHAQYGLMPAFIIWAWVKLFGLSQMSLIGLVTSTSFAAGLALYYLTKRITGSAMTGLVTAVVLSFFYVSRDAYIIFPNMGPVRAQLPTMLGLLLLWLSLNKTKASFLWSFLFGFLVLWEPVLGFLFLLSFLLSHAFKTFTGERDSITKMALCACAVIAPLAAMTLFNIPDYGPIEAVRNICRQYAAFSQGFAALPQVFPSEALLPVLFLLLALWSISGRIIKKGFRLTDTHLFLLSSVIVSAMWAMYSMGRSVTPYFFPLVWAAAPGLALFAYRFIRAKKARKYAAGLIVLLLLLSGAVHEKVFGSISGFMTRYEAERFAWHTECADGMQKGLACAPETKPGYRAAVMQASTRFLQDDTGGVFRVSEAVNGRARDMDVKISRAEGPLIEACKAGVPVVSGLDSLIYMQHGCLPDHRFLSLSILTSKDDIGEFTSAIERHPVIAYDNRLIPHGLERMQEGIRRRLEADGYREYARCADVSLLSKSAAPDWGCPDEPSVSSGIWKGEGDVLYHRGEKMPARIIFGLPGNGRDYTVKARVRVDRGNTAGVIFNARDSLKYHVFYINTDSGTIELWKHDGKSEMGRRNIFTRAAEGVLLRRYVWHEIEARVSGNTASFYINGVPQGQTEIKTLKQAKSGLWAGATDAAFKDLKVIED